MVVNVSQPIPMEFILKKRIGVTVGKSENWLNTKFVKNFLGNKSYKRTSVVYEVISQIAKYDHATHIWKDEIFLSREMEKHRRFASKIDSLLVLDRLRQEVLLIENCSKQKPLRTYLMVLLIFERHFSMSSKNGLENRNETNCLSSVKENPEKNKSQQVADESSESAGKRSNDFSVGDRVLVNTDHQISNKSGSIRYIGKTHIRYGVWFGIELDEPIGKHDGTLDKMFYFKCPAKSGIFVRRDKICRLPSSDKLSPTESA